MMLAAALVRLSSVLSFGCHDVNESSGHFDVPPGTDSIGEYAFKNCLTLKSITIPGSVRIINKGAFENCGLISVSIPNFIAEVAERAFADCSYLMSVNVTETSAPPDTNEIEGKIAKMAFSNCYNLTSVYIPESIQNIGEGAFQLCAQLETITNLGTVKIANGIFLGCTSH